MQKLKKVLIAITGLIFIAVGIFTLINPAKNLETFQVQVQTITAKNEMRAVYGGLHLAIAVIFLQLAFNKNFEKYALKGYILLVGSMVLGRILSTIIDGFPDYKPAQIFYGIETFATVLAIILYLKEKSHAKI